jgi:hypothetical protein
MYCIHCIESISHLSFYLEETLYRIFQRRFIWLLSFRREDYLEIDQSDTRITYGGHVCELIGTKLAIIIEDHLLKVLYKNLSCRPDPITYMAATCNYCF